MQSVISLFDMIETNHAALKEQYKNCTKCPLHINSTRRVFWSGPDCSDLMVVGEAPGKDEDFNGIPFSGKAGVRWNELLAALLIDRDKLHVSNAVWCRPTDGQKNLTPSLEHVKACNQRLLSEISLTNPKVIVTLGKIGTLAVLARIGGLSIPNATAMGKLRGKWFEIIVGGKRISVLPSWHPSFECRSTQMGNYSVNHEMLEDWKKVLKRLPSIKGD